MIAVMTRNCDSEMTHKMKSTPHGTKFVKKGVSQKNWFGGPKKGFDGREVSVEVKSSVTETFQISWFKQFWVHEGVNSFWVGNYIFQAVDTLFGTVLKFQNFYNSNCTITKFWQIAFNCQFARISAVTAFLNAKFSKN